MSKDPVKEAVLEVIFTSKIAMITDIEYLIRTKKDQSVSEFNVALDWMLMELDHYKEFLKDRYARDIGIPTTPSDKTASNT